MVAAAEQPGEISTRAGWAALTSILTVLVAIAALAPKTFLSGVVPLPKPPDALVDRAQEIAKRLAVPAAADSAYSFERDGAYLRYVARTDPSPSRWKGLATARPGPILFLYRQSPRPMTPQALVRVTEDDPPLDRSGMARIVLDPTGRLVRFTAVRNEAAPSEKLDIDWMPFLAEAGFAARDLKPAAPSRRAPVDNDRKDAWDGTYRDQPGVSFHVEAASSRGAPVWFSVFGPWNGPERRGEEDASPMAAFGDAVLWVFFVAVELGGLWLARRNLLQGRGDRRGALRLAAVLFVVYLAAALLHAHHAGGLSAEYPFVQRIVARALYVSALVWIYYVALEPFVRRRWPRLLISWSRLLQGRFRDPLVARDLLVGALAGVVTVLIGQVTILIPSFFGASALSPHPSLLQPLGEAREVAWFLVFNVWFAVMASIAALCFLLILRVALRRDVLAVLA
ncbi:MAG TPA: hypothetical protein VGR00_09010, partial [Thermoanaerobaculia bacterium]|nr:hypothetical protein [Thermoanaerobaculia bacterium]